MTARPVRRRPARMGDGESGTAWAERRRAPSGWYGADRIIWTVVDRTPTAGSHGRPSAWYGVGPAHGRPASVVTASAPPSGRRREWYAGGHVVRVPSGARTGDRGRCCGGGDGRRLSRRGSTPAVAARSERRSEEH